MDNRINKILMLLLFNKLILFSIMRVNLNTIEEIKHFLKEKKFSICDLNHQNIKDLIIASQLAINQIDFICTKKVKNVVYIIITNNQHFWIVTDCEGTIDVELINLCWQSLWSLEELINKFLTNNVFADKISQLLFIENKFSLCDLKSEKIKNLIIESKLDHNKILITLKTTITGLYLVLQEEGCWLSIKECDDGIYVETICSAFNTFDKLKASLNKCLIDANFSTQLINLLKKREFSICDLNDHSIKNLITQSTLGPDSIKSVYKRKRNQLYLFLEHDGSFSFFIYDERSKLYTVMFREDIMNSNIEKRLNMTLINIKKVIDIKQSLLQEAKCTICDLNDQNIKDLITQSKLDFESIKLVYKSNITGLYIILKYNGLWYSIFQDQEVINVKHIFGMHTSGIKAIKGSLNKCLADANFSNQLINLLKEKEFSICDLNDQKIIDIITQSTLGPDSIKSVYKRKRNQLYLFLEHDGSFSFFIYDERSKLYTVMFREDIMNSNIEKRLNMTLINIKKVIDIKQSLLQEAKCTICDLNDQNIKDLITQSKLDFESIKLVYKSNITGLYIILKYNGLWYSIFQDQEVINVKHIFGMHTSGIKAIKGSLNKCLADANFSNQLINLLKEKEFSICDLNDQKIIDIIARSNLKLDEIVRMYDVKIAGLFIAFKHDGQLYSIQTEEFIYSEFIMNLQNQNFQTFTENLNQFFIKDIVSKIDQIKTKLEQLSFNDLADDIINKKDTICAFHYWSKFDRRCKLYNEIIAFVNNKVKQKFNEILSKFNLEIQKERPNIEQYCIKNNLDKNQILEICNKFINQKQISQEIEALNILDKSCSICKAKIDEKKQEFFDALNHIIPFLKDADKMKVYLDKCLEGCKSEEVLKGKGALSLVWTLKKKIVDGRVIATLSVAFLENSLLIVNAEVPDYDDDKKIFSAINQQRINYNNLFHFIKLANILQQFNESAENKESAFSLQTLNSNVTNRINEMG